MSNEELGRRAVACKGWRWMPGMLVRYGGGEAWHRLTDGDGHGYPFRHCPPNPREAWPDLTDPATLGCLSALVREAWKDEGIAAVVASYDHENGYQWRVVHGHHHGSTFRAMSQKRYLTEAEALVAALEAAE